MTAAPNPAPTGATDTAPPAVASTTTAIEVEGLQKSFATRGGRVEAVAGLSFHVAPGEIFGLLGPNGAGKTTTMRMLTTLLPIDAGRAIVAGIDVAKRPRQVRQHIGYVSQLGGADNLASGRENLTLQGALYGMGRRELNRRVEELLELLDLAEFADRRAMTYSGGQRRRLDVALGIVHRPEVLFLDEPSTGLDPQNRANLWEHVRGLADAGTTVVLTTHYLDEADALCARIVIVDHGRIVTEGTPDELKHRVAGATVSITLAEPLRDEPRARTALQAASCVLDVAADGDVLRLHVAYGSAALPEVLRALDSVGVEVASLTLAEASLDDVFLAETGRSLRDAGPAPADGRPS